MIRINKLVKHYGKLEVLKEVSIDFNPGTITAVVGPNGSGKTTLIKTILGLVKPTAGEVIVDGKKVNGEHLYRSKIGYMPQIARYPDNLSIEEVVRMIKDIRYSNDTDHSKLAEGFNLSKELKKPFRNLSGGTKQKVSALIAFLFNPEILILDEPTSGLDPVSSSYLKDMIIREKEKGRTIILTSHNMSDIEELSTGIAFLLEGKIRFWGPTEILRNRNGTKNLERAIATMMSGDERCN